MDFNNLKQCVQQLSAAFRQSAMVAVNSHLTMRNWLVGFYIVEFEQNGEDRAKRKNIPSTIRSKAFFNWADAVCPIEKCWRYEYYSSSGCTGAIINRSIGNAVSSCGKIASKVIVFTYNLVITH
ncbi:MAG: hypothetical protein LBL94_05565 [Prevotellaceae bacterium]|jgi:hypothetical protein|nr:hypothetical protein [Prevotellaceae bacterium]